MSVVREGYRIGVPGDGWYEEILTSDAQTYVGNYGGQRVHGTGWQGKSHSLIVSLPPLTIIGFKRHEA